MDVKLDFSLLLFWFRTKRFFVYALGPHGVESTLSGFGWFCRYSEGRQQKLSTSPKEGKEYFAPRFPWNNLVFSTLLKVKVTPRLVTNVLIWVSQRQRCPEKRKLTESYESKLVYPAQNQNHPGQSALFTFHDNIIIEVGKDSNPALLTQSTTTSINISISMDGLMHSDANQLMVFRVVVKVQPI